LHDRPRSAPRSLRRCGGVGLYHHQPSSSCDDRTSRVVPAAPAGRESNSPVAVRRRTPGRAARDLLGRGPLSTGVGADGCGPAHSPRQRLDPIEWRL
jgi:hypothetical protein